MQEIKSSYELKKILFVIFFVQSVIGFMSGLYLYSWGRLVHDKLILFSSPQTAISLTAFLYGLQKILVFVLEVPTGAYGDSLGRKKTVVLSFRNFMWFFCCLSLLPFMNSFVTVLVTVIIAQIFFSFGATFYSGTFFAWVVDSVRNIDKNLGYEHFFSRSGLYNNVSGLFGGVLGVVFYHYGYAYVAYVIGAFACLLCAVFCQFRMMDSENLNFLDRNKADFTKIGKRMVEIIAVGFKVLKNSNLILVIIVISSLAGFIVQISSRLWPVYIQYNVAPQHELFYWIGLVAAVQIVGALVAYYMTHFFGKYKEKYNSKIDNYTLRAIIIAFSICLSLSILCLSLFTYLGKGNILVLALTILITTLSFSVINPSINTFLNNCIPESHSQERATILSFVSFFSGIVTFLLSIPTGGRSGATTPIGWALPAGLLLIAAIIGNFALKKAQKKIPYPVRERVSPLSPEDRQ